MTNDERQSRIAVISTVHDTYDTRIFYKQIASLQDKYQVVYFSPTNEEGLAAWIVPLHKTRSKIGRVLTHLSLIKQLKRFKCDLYLLHDPELLPFGIALKCLGKKVIWDMHEDTYNDIKTKAYIGPLARILLAHVYKLIQCISFRVLDGFLLAEDQYRSYFSASQKTCVVHNYPLLDRINRCGTVSKDPGTIVYIGSISANRGIHQLLDLVTRLKTKNANIRLVLIGPFTDDQLENSARAYMRKAGIVENVQILGPMKNVDAYPVVARCMVGLALLLPEPNFAKSLPTKMFEYMALGLPVVVSNFPLWESIVRKHQVGAAVDPTDVGSVAEVIDELLADEDRYHLLSRNARRAAQEYSWETENETLQRFVANVLRKH